MQQLCMQLLKQGGSNVGVDKRSGLSGRSTQISTEAAGVVPCCAYDPLVCSLAEAGSTSE